MQSVPFLRGFEVSTKKNNKNKKGTRTVFGTTSFSSTRSSTSSTFRLFESSNTLTILRLAAIVRSLKCCLWMYCKKNKTIAEMLFVDVLQKKMQPSLIFFQKKCNHNESAMEPAVSKGFMEFSDSLIVSLFECLPTSTDFSCYDISKLIIKSLDDQRDTALANGTFYALEVHPKTFENVSAQNISAAQHVQESVEPSLDPSTDPSDASDASDPMSWMDKLLIDLPKVVDSDLKSDVQVLDEAFDEQFDEDFGDAFGDALDEAFNGTLGEGDTFGCTLGGSLGLGCTLGGALGLGCTLGGSLGLGGHNKRKPPFYNRHGAKRKKNTKFAVLADSGPGFQRYEKNVIYIYDMKEFATFYGNPCIPSIKRNANAQSYKVSTHCENTCTLTYENRAKKRA